MTDQHIETARAFEAMGSAAGAQVTLSDFEHLRITDKTELPPRRVIMRLNGQTIAVAGSVFAISGGSKAGKSALIQMAVAASFDSDGICSDGIPAMQVEPNSERKAIVWIDTEQPPDKHKEIICNTLKRANLETCPDELLSYNFLQTPFEVYQLQVRQIIEAANNQFGGVHSVWIDGGADLITSTNNEDESYALVQLFQEIATEYQTPVFVVVHTNPNGDKERGHFGSQLQRKAGGILFVRKDETQSTVEGKLCRYAGIGEIGVHGFVYDKAKGYHVGIGMAEKQDPEQVRKQRLIQEAKKVCEAVFGGQKVLSYSQAIEAIEAHTLKSTAPCKNLFKTMKSKNMIVQGDDKNWRKNNNEDMPS